MTQIRTNVHNAKSMQYQRPCQDASPSVCLACQGKMVQLLSLHVVLSGQQKCTFRGTVMLRLFLNYYQGSSAGNGLGRVVGLLINMM